MYSMKSLAWGKNMFARNTVLLLGLITLARLPAQAQNLAWQKLSLTNIPTEQHGSKMVYDSRRNRIVLHGKTLVTVPGDPSMVDVETWEWDGSQWELVATDGPNVRWHGMAFDEERAVTVVYGGSTVRREGNTNVATLLDDTWSWDGRKWTLVEPGAGPGARHGVAMAYDPVTQKIYLHGGADGGLKSDTWEWDGEFWYRVNSGPSLAASEMTYDPIRDKFVMFGGYNSNDASSSVWEFDRNQWTEIQTDNGPGKRGLHSQTYDPHLMKIVIHGGGIAALWGFPDNGAYFSDTWAWDGKLWERLSTANEPSQRTGSAMVYSPMNSGILLFGGSVRPGVVFENLIDFYLDDTWLLPTQSSGIAEGIWVAY